MEVIIVLILVSLLLASGFLGVFLWAARSGQFEDTTTPPLRILADEPAPRRGQDAPTDLPNNSTHER